MKKENIWNLVGIIFGAVVCIVGIGFLTMAVGADASPYGNAVFGADFYTYTYNATLTAANDLFRIAEMILRIAGAFFLIFGGFIIVFFGAKFTNVCLKGKDAGETAVVQGEQAVNVVTEEAVPIAVNVEAENTQTEEPVEAAMDAGDETAEEETAEEKPAEINTEDFEETDKEEGL